MRNSYMSYLRLAILNHTYISRPNRILKYITPFVGLEIQLIRIAALFSC